MWSLTERVRTPACGRPCEGWGLVGLFGWVSGVREEWSNEGFTVLCLLQGLGMPWLLCFLPFMAGTRYLAIFRSHAHWRILFGKQWSRKSSWRCGRGNASDCKCPSEEGVIGDGGRPQPLSSCMRAGFSCGIQTGCSSYRRSVPLMLSLAVLCSMSCAYVVIRSWMSWTRAGCEQKLWLLLGRPLLGAYKLQRPSGPSGLKNMAMRQALWACFLPGLLTLLVLSNGVRVLGCCVTQVARCGTPAQDADMCPLQLYPATDQSSLHSLAACTTELNSTGICLDSDTCL